MGMVMAQGMQSSSEGYDRVLGIPVGKDVMVMVSPIPSWHARTKG